MFTGIAGMGLISSLFMRALPLHTQVDDRWGIAIQEEISTTVDFEKAMAETSKGDS